MRNASMCVGIAMLAMLAGPAWGQPVATGEAAASLRLPDGVPPVMAAWFWTMEEFRAGGYKAYLDMTARHSGVNLLATSLRVAKLEVTQEAVHAQIKEAADYAGKYGIKIAMDLDVRLARVAFRKAHPDELQEMLRLREAALNDSGTVVARIVSSDLSDHYTGRTTHYIPLSGRLVRVYSYTRTEKGIAPDSVRDITETACKTKVASAKEVIVEIKCGPETKARKACVMASFVHFTPAVFAPHLDEFQRRIIEGYRDTALVGVCKDEWGFPPCFDGCPAKNDYWYSRFRAAAYAKRTGGRDLLRDCLLMTFGEVGRPRDRQTAINHLLAMSTQRNGAIERHFYETTKAVFGPKAVVATHPTWYPYPGLREFKKNGLDWWIAPRDLAQTDEMTPYCARTSLAKKWNSAVWMNMYYSSDATNYDREVWAHALGGGRIDYHPVYPARGKQPIGEREKMLLRGGLMRGDCRVRLLNFISSAPLDCPVAVVFGQACAMNWAGPAYDDVGLAVADGLWRAGFPADLIPAGEIANGSLKISKDGYVQYGPQRYRAAVLYHPEFEPAGTAEFIGRAAGGKTSLHRVGTWTRDFQGKDLDGTGQLPKTMTVSKDSASCVSSVVARLAELGVQPQTPATRSMTGFRRRTCAPPAKGQCRLVDGTVIMISGEKKASGDPIATSFEVRGRTVKVDAIGVVGVRLAKDGTVEALAAGGLRKFETEHLKIILPERIDIAIWRDRQGKMQGVVQGWNGSVPAALAKLSGNWQRLSVPPPLP